MIGGNTASQLRDGIKKLDKKTEVIDVNVKDLMRLVRELKVLVHQLKIRRRKHEKV